MMRALTRPGFWISAAVLLLVLWKGPQWTAPSVEPVAPQATAATQASNTLVQRGHYLARMGNCAFCHTARGGEPFAGGRAIDTPFGAVMTSNITPDRTYGIGQWSADEFWRAMHHGVSQDGRLLYPAFPYISYTHMTRADADALWAYLQTVPPSTQPNAEHTLPWPYGTQLALWAWRLLNFKAADPATASTVNTPPPKVDAALWKRGAYLVEGLGHCFECHSSRNSMGAIEGIGQGSVLPGSRWYAPSLLDRAEASVADWSEAEVIEFLIRGVSAKGQASGPMAEVVLHGTQYLTQTDAQAMASYLRSLSSTASPPAVAEATAGGSKALAQAAGMAPDVSGQLRQGGNIYDKHCVDCHGAKGEGVPGIYPALAGNRAVNLRNTNNLGHVVLRGGFAPATAGNSRPYGMPPFMIALSDAEIAAVLTYVRHEWGNTGATVSEFDITQIRR